jgi:LytS/YehU family sensor histidine kinase
LLIENATKHNIVSQAKPLYIEVFQVGKERIGVKNSLQLKRNVEESTGIGLENINKRCLYLCGKGIVIIKTESAFIVEIPIIANDANSYS